jgi:hypothetical protein
VALSILYRVYRAGLLLRKFLRICEQSHTMKSLPGTNFHPACIVIAMQLGRTTTMRTAVMTLLSGRGLAAAAAIAGVVAITAPTPAEARISTGAAIGIGLGSFVLGSAIASGAFANPYGYYPYGYYAPTYYTPLAPRSCWYPQYGGYYAC